MSERIFADSRISRAIMPSPYWQIRSTKTNALPLLKKRNKKKSRADAPGFSF
ncbi:hypothetical protein KQR56_02850 [Bacillus velezensis]|nr:hypothetical protein [Bacillus velezensis]